MALSASLVKTTTEQIFLHVYTKHFFTVLIYNEFSGMQLLCKFKGKKSYNSKLEKVLFILKTTSQTAAPLVDFEFPVSIPVSSLHLKRDAFMV